MQYSRLDKTQVEIKIARRNISTSDMQMTTPYGRKWRGTKEPLDESNEKSERVDLKLNIQKMNVMESSPITSLQKYGKTMETMPDFISLGSKITADGDCSH